jgi:hypothetical protein
MKDSTSKAIAVGLGTFIVTYGCAVILAYWHAGEVNLLSYFRYSVMSMWDKGAVYYTGQLLSAFPGLCLVGTLGMGVAAITGLGIGMVARLGFADPYKSRVTSYSIRKDPTETHRRGTVIHGAEEVAWALKKSKEPLTNIAFGGVPVSLEAISRHLLLVGLTGMGKSLAVNLLLDAEESSSRAFVVDNGGGVMTRYYNQRRGDIILNPLDSRCEPWSPFAEIESIFDCSTLASAIVPDLPGQDKQWSDYAQTFLRCILERLHGTDGAINREFYRFVTTAPAEELSTLLEETEAGAYLAKGNEKLFGTARTIATTNLQGFKQLDQDAGANAFSIKKFMRANKGWMFIPYNDNQARYLSNIICTWMDVAILAGMEKISTDKKYFVFDEFDSLGRVGSVRNGLLSKGRKYGCCAIIGVQVLAQIVERYGKEGASAITGNCSTWLVFRTPDPDMSEQISKKIGNHQIERRVASNSASRTRGKNRTVSNGQSEQVQVVTERAVMPEEIQQLAKLEGFLMTNEGATCPIRLDFPPRRVPRTEPFVPKMNQSRINPVYQEATVGFE